MKTYGIRAQGDSWLVMEYDPTDCKNGERLMAVCGNSTDATRLWAGLIATRLDNGPVIGHTDQTGA